MIPPTHEFHRERHSAHTARLHSEMAARAPFSPRLALGSFMVGAGLRLAPDARHHRRLRELREAPETDRVSGCAHA